MSSAYVTPPRLAKRLAVSPEKVLGWIRRGELRAVDVADKQGGRPRWRIRRERYFGVLGAAGGEAGYSAG